MYFVESDHSAPFPRPTSHLTPLPSGNTAPPEQSGREAEHLLGVI